MGCLALRTGDSRTMSQLEPRVVTWLATEEQSSNCESFCRVWSQTITALISGLWVKIFHLLVLISVSDHQYISSIYSSIVSSPDSTLFAVTAGGSGKRGGESEYVFLSRHSRKVNLMANQLSLIMGAQLRGFTVTSHIFAKKSLTCKCLSCKVIIHQTLIMYQRDFCRPC